MIQASTAHSSSPLLAEADALLFATKVAAQVQAHGVTFLTDNLTLARAASATTITNDQVPWELRQQISGYKRDSEEMQSKIYHINRNVNGVAHDCAQQAIRRPLSLPIFTCLNSAHRCIGSCPFALSFKILNSRDMYFLMYFAYELNENVAPPAPFLVQKKKKIHGSVGQPKCPGPNAGFLHQLGFMSISRAARHVPGTSAVGKHVRPNGSRQPLIDVFLAKGRSARQSTDTSVLD
jgi:hypothetical protein